ncbi:MAG: hypothetical protein BHW33_03505 [Firmicutes bacterium CAG:137_57_8]|nr:MAG: hypothetical protein BHW33_03505 [Firmicutes bacterium CAG:137_57_8]
MVSWIFQKVRKTLQMKPLLLWGIRLLAGLLVWLAAIGFWAVPAVAFALNLVLSGSVALIFLRAYQGTFHLVGGMAWMSLWVFLWTLIPVAGLVLGPVKLYTYRLTPYILMTRPDVKATEAIQVSARETKGYRGKMFLADLLIYGSWALVLLLLLGLAQIRFLHVPFYVLLALAAVLGAALTPLVAGLAQAGFYDEIQHCLADPAYSARYAPPAPPAYIPPAAGQQPQGSAGANVQYCPICGQAAPKSARFCNNCGTKLDGSTL